MSRHNLAYDRRSTAPVAVPAQESPRKGKIMARPRMSADHKLYYEEKARYEKQSTRRFRRVMQISLCVLALSALAIFLLYQQSTLFQAGAANSALVREINRLSVDNSQKESELLAKTNMNDLLAKALELGFKDPGQAQSIFIAVPKEDKLLVDQNEQNFKVEPYGEVLDHLEAYFSEHAIQP